MIPATSPAPYSSQFAHNPYYQESYSQALQRQSISRQLELHGNRLDSCDGKLIQLEKQISETYRLVGRAMTENKSLRDQLESLQNQCSRGQESLQKQELRVAIISRCIQDLRQKQKYKERVSQNALRSIKKIAREMGLAKRHKREIPEGHNTQVSLEPKNDSSLNPNRFKANPQKQPSVPKVLENGSSNQKKKPSQLERDDDLLLRTLMSQNEAVRKSWMTPEAKASLKTLEESLKDPTVKLMIYEKGTSRKIREISLEQFKNSCLRLSGFSPYLSSLNAKQQCLALYFPERDETLHFCLPNAKK